MAAMTPAAADAFLRETRIAKLAYLDGSGAPTIVPIWFDWDGTVARMFTPRTSRKARAITVDPRVALSVEEPVGVVERWVTVEGIAAIGEDGTMELLERLSRRYYDQEGADEAIQAWSANPGMWITLTVTPTRTRSVG